MTNPESEVVDWVAAEQWGKIVALDMRLIIQFGLYFRPVVSTIPYSTIDGQSQHWLQLVDAISRTSLHAEVRPYVVPTSNEFCGAFIECANEMEADEIERQLASTRIARRLRVPLPQNIRFYWRNWNEVPRTG